MNRFLFDRVTAESDSGLADARCKLAAAWLSGSDARQDCENQDGSRKTKKPTANGWLFVCRVFQAGGDGFECETSITMDEERFA